ncbi:regulatory protein RecX [Oxalobacteraceae bacterium R-40]|uniref:Regulatory protein RecX n=1 Tax=Keguizhuia sedimenti TaxID=3064264 RepID=A0ABU1BKK8_9BURK|nr:regulatory protein RecX [Oxalobacteraceae bacterium R-40]
MQDKTDVRYSRTSERSPGKTRGSKTPEKPRHSAKAYAIWLLSKREYSAATLRKKLLARGYDAEETATAMQFLQENNYQSDSRYAGMKARSTAHRAGDWKISRQLVQKGVAEELAKEQIAELPPEDERAAQAANAKFLQQVIEAGMSPELSQKIWRYLGYRGFSSHAIKHALTCLRHEAST